MGVSTINRLPNKIFLSKKKTSDDRDDSLRPRQSSGYELCRWCRRLRNPPSDGSSGVRTSGGPVGGGPTAWLQIGAIE